MGVSGSKEQLGKHPAIVTRALRWLVFAGSWRWFPLQRLLGGSLQTLAGVLLAMSVGPPRRADVIMRGSLRWGPAVQDVSRWAQPLCPRRLGGLGHLRELPGFAPRTFQGCFAAVQGTGAPLCVGLD